MRRLDLLLAAPLLLAAAPPQDNGQKWNDWVYRANSIMRALESGEESQVNTVCRNITREMMGMASLPIWARELVGTCDALKEGLARGRSGSFCRKARENAKALRKASPVAEEPRAYPMVMKLADAMDGLYQGLCR